MDLRIESLRRRLMDEEVDIYLVANSVNIGYLTGFFFGSTLLISRDGEQILYVYRVNYEAAKDSVEAAEVKVIDSGEDILTEILKDIKALKPRMVAFDSMNASSYIKVKDSLGDVEVKPASKLIMSMRRIKDDEELGFMRRAAELTSLGMKVAYETIKPGMKERELAAEIEYAMRREGSDGVAFDTIVASGKRSAYPHGGCTDNKIGKGEFIVIDIGAKYMGYCSDMTRTVILGEPSRRQMEIFKVVAEAQRTAIKHAREGIRCSEVDYASRRFIEEMGYGEYFVHGLGHGVGLEIHEPPTLNKKSMETLKSRDVITIEPGIYIPGFGGVRIEDTVLISGDGAEKLTDAPYNPNVKG